MVEKVWLKRSGYCESIEGIAIKGGSLFKKLQFPATWGLIKHQRGYVLFDTGYSSFFGEVTSKFPKKIYKKLLGVKIDEGEYIFRQLQRMGIKVDDIKYVVISHFHPDHIGGLRHFSKSKLVYSKKNLRLLENRDRGINPLFFKELVPEDIQDRTILVEDLDRVYIDDLSPFGECYDLFSDRTLILVPLEGHALGQMGLYTEDNMGRKWFFVSDACWHENDYKNESRPGGIRRLISDDYPLFWKNVDNIRNFYKAHPDAIIIPSHCRQTFQRINAE
jgi:glyoxylase-like metal-dependent hydrolase (beta-lactamase superfamily II)